MDTKLKKQTSSYGIIAGMLFLLVAVLKVVYLYQMFTATDHWDVFKLMLRLRFPALLPYLIVTIALIRKKRDLFPVIAFGILFVVNVFVPKIIGSPLYVLVEAVASVGMFVITLFACTNLSAQGKSIVKRCWFIPAVFMTLCSPLIYFGFWSAGRGVARLAAIVTALALFFAAKWAVLEIPKENPIRTRDGTTVYTESEIYCGLMKHILLLIFTCGIWYLIWIYRITGYLNQVKDEPPRNPTTKLLLCMFVPFYSVYWVYKSAQRIDKIAANNGVSSDLSTLCLILSIFVAIIPPILMQDKINAILTADSNSKQSIPQEQPTATPKPNLGVAEELKTYKELLDSGVITQEEFEAKKKQLLGL